MTAIQVEWIGLDRYRATYYMHGLNIVEYGTSADEASDKAYDQLLLNGFMPTHRVLH